PSAPRSKRDGHAIAEDALEPIGGAGGRRRRVPRPGAGTLDDPTLQRAARDKDWATLLADKRVEALLADEKALELILTGAK
ncbi:MAG: hypothetical protein KC502_23955, partial [Myxococcales bacterium]|nr:hypothetical protein [Myxococcales bacterium]